MAETFKVRIPAGVVAGQEMQVAVPAGYPTAGQLVTFVVPSGVSPGSIIEVRLPTIAVAQATAQEPVQPVLQPIQAPQVTVVQQPAPIIIDSGPRYYGGYYGGYGGGYGVGLGVVGAGLYTAAIADSIYDNSYYGYNDGFW